MAGPLGTQKWKHLRAQVLRESRVCHVCERDGADSVDHIVPRAVAPELTFVRANLAPAHLTCNASKGARPTPPRRRTAPVEGESALRW